jgi:hypothetical protein
MAMRRFRLVRYEDVSGISGTGVVAEGCLFSAGWVVLIWLGERPSVAIYHNVEDLLAIHAHGGKTKIEWLDG